MENKVKNYWEERAVQNQNAITGTTNDVFLRELEIKTIREIIRRLQGQSGARILDIGCGDGYTTLNIAKEFPEMKFVGIDYSENMIANALTNLKGIFSNVSNASFKVADVLTISECFESGGFDFILSDRCLINLENKANQFEAIRQISILLKPGGYYLAIENFVEGQNNLTEARKKMGLTEIPIRWHNLFFVEAEFIRNASQWFGSVDFSEFASSYYFATRVIYSAICKLQNIEPDYLNDIHKVSIDLPTNGKYSPIRLAVLKK